MIGTGRPLVRRRRPYLCLLYTSLSGSQTLYAGSYTGNMTWHAVWDDPVVGGE